MPEQLITSLDDPRLEPFRHLKQTNLTRWSGRFIAEGIRLVERLLASDFAVESILVSPELRRRLPEALPEQVELLVAPLPLLEQVVGYQFHAGMLGCGRRKLTLSLAELAGPADRPRLLVGCPRTSDPDNLGTIIRVAAALGADGLLVGEKSADPFSRRALRISMGNAFFLPIRETTEFDRDLELLKHEHGVSVVASALSARAIPLAQAERPGRMILLLGNESDGLPETQLQHADELVVIPMAERIDSLNVGIAAGILLHHYAHAARVRR